MSRHLRPLLLLAAVALAACGASAPTRFYTLMPSSAPALSATPADYRIDVLPVGIPAGVDQPQLVVRESDDRVALLEGERWSAPLGDQIRDAVSSRLAAALGAVDVHGLPEHGKAPVYRVKLDVRRFESVPGQFARIDAAWSVVAAGHPDAVLACASSLVEPVGAGYAALVRGHQKALAALSARIAGVVRAMAADRDAACP